jgi:hypothetical protein
MEPASICTALVRIGFLDAAALAIVEEQGLRTLRVLRPSPNGTILDNFVTWGYAILYEYFCH